jgi:plasmid stability protein
MSTARRATIYLNPDVHRALRMKAAEIDQSLSEVVNAVLRQSLLEDADDLAAFDERAHEPNMDFGALVKDLKRRGKL